MTEKDPSPRASLQVYPIQTRIYSREQDLISFILEFLPSSLLQEETVIAITSKIVSITEGELVPKLTREGSSEYKKEKTDLVKKNADRFLGETLHGVNLTLKHGILIPTSGIDESNSEGGQYILFPKDPYQSAHRIWIAIRDHFKLKKLGVILTDSHTTPLRKGVTGIGLAHAGFKATRDLIGNPDLFGRTMKMTQVNVLDALSTAAVFEMGETNDACPMAVIHARNIEFTDSSKKEEIQIAAEDDLYGYLFFKS